jgi:hypothetical protein
MPNPFIGPVVALVAWSIVMMVWMFIARSIGMQGIDPKIAGKPGMRGVDLEGVVADKYQWPAHNYMHLMEQPTLFYALCLALAIAGPADTLNVKLAWAYVVLRVLHSLVQATINKVMTARFPLWAISSIVLAVMTVRAVMQVFQ